MSAKAQHGRPGSAEQQQHDRLFCEEAWSTREFKVKLKKDFFETQKTDKRITTSGDVVVRCVRKIEWKWEKSRYLYPRTGNRITTTAPPDHQCCDSQHQMLCLFALTFALFVVVKEEARSR
jgi:hypothetical protein